MRESIEKYYSNWISQRILFIRDPCSEPRISEQVLPNMAAREKEIARDKMAVQWASRMTSSLQGTKGHKAARTSEFIDWGRDLRRGLANNSKGNLMLRRNLPWRVFLLMVLILVLVSEKGWPIPKEIMGNLKIRNYAKLAIGNLWSSAPFLWV